MEDYMEVILARVDAIRRRGADALPQLREAFAAATQTLQVENTADMLVFSKSMQSSNRTSFVSLLKAAVHWWQGAFGEVSDPLLRLPSYWADCEAHLAKDVAAARAVWEAVLKTAAGK
jgi:squamous cell carcinoma antigen recognized by T-cells 3